jgi:hypothetical protein
MAVLPDISRHLLGSWNRLTIPADACSDIDPDRGDEFLLGDLYTARQAFTGKMYEAVLRGRGNRAQQSGSDDRRIGNLVHTRERSGHVPPCLECVHVSDRDARLHGLSSDSEHVHPSTYGRSSRLRRSERAGLECRCTNETRENIAEPIVGSIFTRFSTEDSASVRIVS